VRRFIAVAIAVTFGVAIARTADASAYDAYPCAQVQRHPTLPILIQYCPDWSPDGWIPLYDLPNTQSRIVDWIYAPGNDWYLYQCLTSSVYALGRYQNNWWAATKGDGRFLGGNGVTGWAPETYFRGGGNFERDRTLTVETSCPH
jgi:hypothetical protein